MENHESALGTLAALLTNLKRVCYRLLQERCIAAVTTATKAV